jgi:hypothetical protein
VRSALQDSKATLLAKRLVTAAYMYYWEVQRMWAGITQNAQRALHVKALASTAEHVLALPLCVCSQTMLRRATTCAVCSRLLQQQDWWWWLLQETTPQT